MAAARIAQKTAEVEPLKEGLAHSYLFTATSSEVLDGFLKVMALDIRKKKPEEDEAEEESDEVDRLPPLAEGDRLVALDWLCDRKETKPPSRHSEAR